jgi:hypothetical protein
VLDDLRESRGADLDVALAGEPRMIALLKPLVEAPAPVDWEKLTLQQLVEAFIAGGPKKTG